MSMKYSSVFFIAAFLVWLIVVNFGYFEEVKGSDHSHLSHGFYLMIGVVSWSVFGNIHFMRHSKIFKRNMDAMKYQDV